MSDESKTKELAIMAESLRKLQIDLEPVRNKALDQKAFYTGYAQCAETFIKIIVNRASAFSEQIRVLETAENTTITEELPKEESEGEVIDNTTSPE